MASIDSVTMLDVLNDEKEMEDETAAVLGGSDEKNCTYIQVKNATYFFFPQPFIQSLNSHSLSLSP